MNDLEISLDLPINIRIDALFRLKYQTVMALLDSFPLPPGLGPLYMTAIINFSDEHYVCIAMGMTLILI